MTPLKPDALTIRRRLGRKLWSPPEPFGPAGFRFRQHEPVTGVLMGEVLVTQSPLHNAEETGDFTEWIHASIVVLGGLPTYEHLAELKFAVWGPEGEAYQVFAPESKHVNIHPGALHIFGRADGKPVLPDFAPFGSI